MVEEVEVVILQRLLYIQVDAHYLVEEVGDTGRLVQMQKHYPVLPLVVVVVLI
jgi:hypothetical protein